MKNRVLSEFTDQKIKTVMLDLLLEKPYFKIRITDITTLANINRTTFCLFYQSKEELVQCICEDYLTQYGQELKESLETGNLDLTLVVRYFDNLPKQKDLLKVIFRWICPNTILTGKCKPRLKRLFWIFFRTSTLMCHSIGFISLRPYLRQTP
ncbi:TetR/AcrR family transcriptional regulator [uncultured Streptococcus sp.]|uniref:TetR/AcrR family transcriptional regulator n=1 Tax=uncultured Streptococcus sp. TaxID=83427 RepID=UPI0025D4CEDF|nr:hypothetical protein [uncultured Streptococcus sp.]